MPRQPTERVASPETLGVTARTSGVRIRARDVPESQQAKGRRPSLVTHTATPENGSMKDAGGIEQGATGMVLNTIPARDCWSLPIAKLMSAPHE